MKKIRSLLLAILCVFAFSASAQLINPVVEPGPYTPGSSIAVTFEIDPNACIGRGNTFELWLSDASGNFSTETRIGTYNAFYSTFINGDIPLSTPTGTGYRLRVKSTTPGFVSAGTSPFEIRSGAATQATLITSASLSNESFGFCMNRTDGSALINITNTSTTGAAITMTAKNELSGGNTPIPFTNNESATFTPQAAHYTAIVKVVMPNGNVGTRAYFIINNEVNTAFIPGSNPYVCLPGGSYEYFVDVTGVKGIQKNFPGNTYRINWGDNTGGIYTYCDLKGGKIEHFYTKSSCGLEFTSGTTTFNNVFGIIVQQESPFSCGGNSQVGNPVATTVKVVTLTQNRLEGPENVCTKKEISFTNTSVLGQDPNSNSPECKSVNARFNWYVNGVLRKQNVPVSENFNYTFPTHGNYIIKLESITVTNCTSTPYEFEVCVQDEPKPAFTLSSNLTCLNSPVQATDASIVDAICNTNNTYRWEVTPSAGVTFNATDKNPNFVFGSAGKYDITLSINTETCGEITTQKQTVVVNTAPTAVLSSDQQLCNLATYDFTPTTTGPTKTLISGTYEDLPDTYTWLVTGGAFEFTGGTTTNSKYPSIKFNAYTTYTITVIHKNNCGPDAVATQKLSFSTAPQVNAGADQTICFKDGTVSLTGVITGTTSNSAWVGGNGTFTPNRNSLNATYAPTPEERTAGQVTLILRATTSLPAPCNSIDDEIIIKIKPLVTGTSESTKSICTGTSVSYIPTSETVGATFTWTAVGSANASGYTTSGTGNINDIISNTDPINNATVTYTLVPTGDGCEGQPFTLTVTVTPIPVVTATAANATICSDSNTGITLTSTINGTRYTWTSSVTGSITGASSQSTGVTTSTIDDLLSNTGTSAGTVTYTITPISAEGCPGQSKTVTITVEPALSQPDPGAPESICNQGSYTFKAIPPTVGTGKWTQVTAFPNIVFSNDANPAAVVSGLQPGNTYIFRWTISGGTCQAKSADIAITVNTPTVGGTTSGTNNVCAGSNQGTIVLAGETGTILRWEFSTDNGSSWSPRNETTSTINYTNLTVTTQFRAIIKNGSCPEAVSTVTTITVNAGVVPANAGPNQALCNVTSTTLAANSPLPNTGLWTKTEGPAVTFTDPTSPTTTVTNLIPGQSYKFVWTITGAASCPPSTSTVQISVALPSNGGNTTASTSTVCAGSNAGTITLSGHTGTILRWESSTDDFATTTTITSSDVSIPFQNLTVTTKYRALVQSGTCASALSTVTTITVNQQPNLADAGPDQLLCAQTSTVLAGNLPINGTGLWTQISGPAGALFSNATLNNTTVTGLTSGATYVFQWRISGTAPCPATDNTVTVTNSATILNNTIPAAQTICSGQTFQIVGSTPTGGDGTYIYSWESSTNGTAWTVIAGATAKDYTATPSNTTLYRRTITSGSCSSTSGNLEIKVLAPIANNSITPVPAICENQQPAQLVGSIPTGGDETSYTFRWEQSVDGLTWQVIPSATGQNYQPPALTVSTSYRRTVTTPTCTTSSSSTSATIKVTVNPNAKAEFTAQQTTSCAPFIITATNVQAVAYPDRNATYNWYAGTTLIGSGITFPGARIDLPNQSLDITLEVTSSLGCQTSKQILTFSTVQSIEASFTVTPTETCGTTPIVFQNTSTTLTGVTFEWFVDGQLSSTAPEFGTQTFAPDPAGIDKTYNVMLRVTSNCGSDDSPVIPIVIRSVPPQPALRPSRTSGCSILEVTFDILSTARSSNTYIVNFGDGTGDQTFNFGQPIVHQFENLTNDFKDYPVTITAKNSCGTTPGAPINIRVFPAQIQAAFFLDATQSAKVCAGKEVIFTNNTKGAESYIYDFGDGRGPVTIPSTGVTSYPGITYSTPGTYTITMIAANSCPSQSAPITITIEVIATPTSAFTADVISGCSGFEAKFTNNSVGATSYLWNFGDGKTSTEFEPKHTYIGDPGKYTVTLTATNSLGCNSVPATKDNYITIAPKPNAEFQVLPGNTIGVPNFKFDFVDLDRTTSPGKTYLWDFGDGSDSPSKNPSHTYLDTGSFKVIFTVTNEFGCQNISQQVVRITGVPGYLHVPNSFIPGGTSIPLQTFYAVGSGIASWRMSVFNKWGQVLWETTKLVDGKPVEAWDGTFKGVPQPQGIYFWKIEVNLINGTEWKGVSYDRSTPKRTGEIYLIR